ncbi:DUF6452 family protein [Arenibacter sp. M-2]|uniref:DUF6452 family protein n=1 Tax=unclassified Arenibacter TaxID=2615047 RepID=UPI000D773544|nr:MULTISPECIES: DUF6452 family protein [unclassified Arenibacter]MDL5511548.1 DUF6452 family protein [Arenibacter sp. M-2]PXX23022.1 hypothetical protein C7972_12110 [Arenibacter sp. ARW7G5Y1]
MKKFYIPILVLIILICFGACEKDDICIDGDTPLLVIRFYNVDNPTVLKKVTKLRIVGVGQNTTVTTVSDRTDLDSIAIPLKVTENSTGFYFIRNSADVETTDSGGETITVEGGDLDTLYLNYTKIDKFVSRACGYIANYEELNSDLKMETDNWIKDIEIVTPLVENSTAAHVKIFH